MKLYHVAWMLVFTLGCITSILGYREWQRYCDKDIYAQVVELQEKVETLQEEQPPFEQYVAMVAQSRMQSIANIANICAVAGRIETVNNRLSDLIDKLASTLPNGAYILPQKGEMDKFNPRVILPPETQPAPAPIRGGLGLDAPIVPNPFDTCPPIPPVIEQRPLPEEE